MRIAFLFNHDQVHQVAHGLPIALALAKRHSGDEILLCSGSERITNELRLLGGKAIGDGLTLVELRLVSRSSRLANGIVGKLVPSSKLLIYRDNLDFFKSLDVLVVPEKTSLVLKDHFHLDNLKIIHTRHGAGDRAIGFGAASARFDHVLASGPKIRSRLIAEAGVSPDKVTVVGYPKFDLFDPPERVKRPSGERTTVLYNPHLAPHLSSWYRNGRAILRWFAANPAYQLIFAPHIMLFERRLVVTIQPPRIARPGRIAKDLLSADNILVDTHSRALTTMEYPNRADIYLGDASSQVYEFLAQPRPCLFFNAHGFSWEGDPNFAHWRAGRVASDVSELSHALSTAFDDHDRRYRQVQTDMLRDTFDLTSERSSDRAADVIMKVAGLRLEQKPGRGLSSRSIVGEQAASAIATHP